MVKLENMKKEKASVLLIYTGGTIGMVQDAEDNTLKPFDFEHILDSVPEIRNFTYKIDTHSFDPLIDSSDVEPELWQRLARLIASKYDSYDGFVVLHGTDTMAYTASALSFMLEDLTKPVILTGSQLPIGVARTDGRENIISSVEIAAAKDEYGHAMVPEVCIYFNNNLMRGNRASKTSADDFAAFRSLNYPMLATTGVDIKYNREFILKPRDWNAPLKLHTKLDTRVSILKIHPGITPGVVRDILNGSDTRAVILETYGSGNAPSKDWLIEAVREASETGKILVNVTQCPKGAVNMDIYANGRALKEAGVLGGYDCTTESALAKLFCILGQNKSSQQVKSEVVENLRGEISK